MSPGNGHSLIDLHDISVSLQCDDVGDDAVKAAELCDSTDLEVMIFRIPTDSSHNTIKRWMDYWPQDNLCCTEEMYELEECSSDQRGSLISPPIKGLVKTTIKVGREPVSLGDYPLVHNTVTQTGMHIVVFGVCSPFNAPVELHGSIDSMDPYGYLPADLYGDMPFYMSLSVAYTILGLFWGSLCWTHQHELINMQYWIAIIVALGMLESAFLYDHFLTWNEQGTADAAKGIEIMGILFGVLKRAISRVFILMVSMGYGVVKPSLGEDTRRILMLGMAYAFFAFIYDVTSSISSTSHEFVADDTDFSGLVVIGLAACDAVFYIWTFSAINELIVNLEVRKQQTKVALYYRFRGVLVAAFVLCVLWGLYSSIYILNDDRDNNWQERWAVDAMYEVIYFVIFMAMAVLWAPAKNNQRYAYSIELSSVDDKDDDDEISPDDEETGGSIWSNETESRARLMTSRGNSPKRTTASTIINGNTDEEMDMEYGGSLRDASDPTRSSDNSDGTSLSNRA